MINNEFVVEVEIEDGEYNDILYNLDNNNTMIEKFDSIIADSIINEVSCIHINASSSNSEVKNYRHGSIISTCTWDADFSNRISEIVFNVLDEDKSSIFNCQLSQSAAFTRHVLIPGKGIVECRIRLQTLPKYPAGYTTIIKIIKMCPTGNTSTLEELGYSTNQIEKIRKFSKIPVGCTIISGTEGSGMLTSAFMFLNDFASENISDKSNIVKYKTVEHPPEYEINYLTQSGELNSTKNYFKLISTDNIHETNKVDPESILLLKVRDDKSAKNIVDAAQTGHNVITTINASDSINIVTRLRALGVSKYALGDKTFIKALIHQHLLPVNCSHCKLTFKSYFSRVKTGEIETKERSKLSHQKIIEKVKLLANCENIQKITFKNKDGCENCNKTGISGRTVVAEIIVPDEFMALCFLNGKESDAINYHLEHGGKLILDHAVDKMLAGIIDPWNVYSKFGRINS